MDVIAYPHILLSAVHNNYGNAINTYRLGLHMYTVSATILYIVSCIRTSINIDVMIHLMILMNDFISGMTVSY